MVVFSPGVSAQESAGNFGLAVTGTGGVIIAAPALNVVVPGAPIPEECQFCGPLEGATP